MNFANHIILANDDGTWSVARLDLDACIEGTYYVVATFQYENDLEAFLEHCDKRGSDSDED